MPSPLPALFRRCPLSAAPRAAGALVALTMGLLLGTTGQAQTDFGHSITPLPSTLATGEELIFTPPTNTVDPILPGNGFDNDHVAAGSYYPELTILPQGLIFRPFLASEKESRIRGFWAKEKDDGRIWDTTLGGHIGIIRYGSTGDTRPTGWQLDIEGAGIPRLDLDVNADVISADFRVGIPLTFGNERYQTKFGYYHLSSHLGDEFLLRNPGFPRLNYSRDVLIWGHSYNPHPDYRIYAEAGYAFKSDVARQWEFQFGTEWSPGCGTGPRGAPFAAFNASLREELNYGGNFVVQTGWAWRRSAASGLLRVGVEYFNGKSDQFSFFNDFESKFGFGMWYDY
jgi:hypothetical protein